MQPATRSAARASRLTFALALASVLTPVATFAQEDRGAVVTHPFTGRPRADKATRGLRAERDGDELPPRLHLQRSMLGADADQGALFSLLRDAGAEDDEDATTYSTDFYLFYTFFRKEEEATRARELEADLLNFTVSAEGHASSNDDKAEDAWRFRGSASIFFHQEGDFENGLNLTASAKYESDRDFETEALAAEMILTPILPGLGISRDAEFAGGFRWRPLFVAEVGHMLDVGPDAEELPDTLVRLSPQVDARLRVLERGGTVPIPVFRAVDLFVQDRYYYLPNVGGGRTHNLFLLGTELIIREGVSVAATYTVGSDAPEFEKAETLEVGLSIKF